MQRPTQIQLRTHVIRSLPYILMNYIYVQWYLSLQGHWLQNFTGYKEEIEQIFVLAHEQKNWAKMTYKFSQEQGKDYHQFLLLPERSYVIDFTKIWHNILLANWSLST